MTGVLNRVAGVTARSATLNLASLSRAYNALPRLQRACLASKFSQISSSYAARAYATESPRKTTTKTVTKTVTKKKPAAKKPAAKKKTTTATKKPAAKKKAIKAKPKKKVVRKVAKKVAPKIKRQTPLQKAKIQRTAAKAEIDELTVKALTVPPRKVTSNITLYMLRQKGTSKSIAELRDGFKALSDTEREQLNRDAAHNKTENDMAYHNWILQHTPEQIREANAARVTLRHRVAKYYPKRKPSKISHTYTKLKDERQVKRPNNAHAIYLAERFRSGAFAGQPVTEAAKLIAAEYKSLSTSEKKQYTDLVEADKARYVREFTDTFGRAPPAPKAKALPKSES